MGYFDEIPAAPHVLGLLDPFASPMLRQRVTRVELSRGKAAYRQGMHTDQLFLLEEGKVKLQRRAPDGRESIVALLGSGDVLGEACVLDDQPNAVSAIAVTDVVLLGVPTLVLTEWLDENPMAVLPLLKVLARRVRCANDSLTERTYSEVAARVAREVLSLADRFGRRTSLGVRVEHDLTQDELAQLVGSCRETVNKALGDFAARGWLRVEARSVVVLDRGRLGRRARSAGRSCVSGPRPTGPAVLALDAAAVLAP
jgi:CRP/FNR family transcriptional regulator, cyclic AMP receptor protein